MADVEKTLRYKVEVDDTEAKLKLSQMATMGRLGLESTLPSLDPMSTVRDTPYGPMVSPGTNINFSAAPIQPAASAVGMGIYDAGRSVYGFARRNIVDPIAQGPSYNDILMSNGRFALESTVFREVTGGLFGMGISSSDEFGWSFSKAKPEWMTGAEYRTQLKESLGKRASDFVWGGMKAGSHVAALGLPDFGLISGEFISRGVDIAEEQYKYMGDVDRYLKYSGAVGARSGIGFSPLSERDRMSAARMMQKMDVPYWRRYLGQEQDLSMKDSMELAGEVGLLDTGIEDPEQLVGKVKDIRNYLMKYAELMHTTRENVAEIAGRIGQLGVTDQTEIENVLANIRSTSSFTGLNVNQLLQQYTSGMGTASQMGYNPLLGMRMMNENMSFYQSMKDSGQLRPWETPVEKAQSLNAGVMGLARTPVGNSLMMAALDPNTGKMDEDILARIQSGDISIGQAVQERFSGLDTTGKYRLFTNINAAMNSIDIDNPREIRGIAQTMLSMYKGYMGEDRASAYVAAQVSKLTGGKIRPAEVELYLNDEAYNRSRKRAGVAANVEQLRREGIEVESMTMGVSSINEEEFRSYQEFSGGSTGGAAVTAREFIPLRVMSKKKNDIDYTYSEYAEAREMVINDPRSREGIADTPVGARQDVVDMINELADRWISEGMDPAEAQQRASASVMDVIYRGAKIQKEKGSDAEGAVFLNPEALRMGANLAMMENIETVRDPSKSYGLYNREIQDRDLEVVSNFRDIELSRPEKAELAQFMMLRKRIDAAGAVENLSKSDQKAYWKLSSKYSKYVGQGALETVYASKWIQRGMEINPIWATARMIEDLFSDGVLEGDIDLSRGAIKDIVSQTDLESYSEISESMNVAGSLLGGLYKSDITKEEKVKANRALVEAATMNGDISAQLDVLSQYTRKGVAYKDLIRQAQFGIVSIKEDSDSYSDRPEGYHANEVDIRKVNELLEESKTAVRELSTAIRMGSIGKE
ncbi:MAG: hypothetical protein SVK08_00130 [Halobacteriota archaeon]|nr:hypothetical protein [Halobacteriota archaeon]